VPTGTLAIALTDVPVNLGILDIGLVTNRPVINPMADYLVYVKSDTHEMIPGLATRWEISDDKKSIHFWLREGVQFHDGWGELTSEDVMYSFEIAMSDASETRMRKIIAPYIDRLEAPGPYEFVVHFKEAPNADFAPHWFSSAKGAEIPITCKKYVEQVGYEEANVKPIYSGPYKYSEQVFADYLKLEAVDNHWRVIPEFKYLEYKHVPEEVTRIAMFSRGDVDIAEVTTEAAGRLGDEESTTVVPVRGGSAVYLSLWGQWLPTRETYDPEVPWLDKSVREAMNLAINKDDIVEHIFSGFGTPSGVPFVMPWSDEFEP
jgi:peptide/nickel transport system substrate-binding protein